MAENSNDNGDLELKNRLSALDAALQNQQKEAAGSSPAFGAAGIDAKALRASRIGTELLVAIGGGVALGWALDKTFGTMPLFILVCAFLGFGAGILNVWCIIKRQNEEQK